MRGMLLIHPHITLTPTNPRNHPNTTQVIQIVSNLCPIMALYQCFDGFQGVSAGVLRGMGRQTRVALLNLGGFWVLGLPLGAFLAFVGGLGVYGIWWGFNAGAF
jgi:multidrug resistance protein, MATE family